MVSSPEVRQGTLPPGFLVEREVEPVGRWFLHQWERLNSNRTKSNVSMCESSESEEEKDPEVEFEDDLDYLRSLDPKETKEQDHYRVLGLSKLRMAATDEQIKKAHRFKVLKHHPDKRKAAGEDIKEGDDYFSCITKALEVLGSFQTRRAFDSVDPTFDDDVPKALEKGEKQENFFKVFGPKIAANSRWSIPTPVPQLGEADSTREQVDGFYSFWFEFNSWREYSYLDEEDKEKAGDKWERREIDKINKANRKEKKAEETKRIRKLVDNAYNSDPRIARFRKEELEEKAAKKKAKADQAKARRDEEERVRKEAEAEQERIKEAEEAEKLKKAGAAKAEKEAQKKALKAERKKLRTLAKENNMFATTPAESTDNLLEMEKMCEVYDTAQLAALVARLTKDPALARRVFLSEIAALNGRMDDQRALEAESTEKTEGGPSSSKAGVEWATEELQLLVKAVKMFPAGTNQRWDVVTEYVNQHNDDVAVRAVKETIAKAKELQNSSFAMNNLMEEVNKAAYENSQKSQKKEVLERCAEESKGTERTDTPADQQGLNPTAWTPDEQKLLEQALKTFDSKTAERWERISEAVPGRSKKDCMKRYKELAEVVKAKKAAALAASKKK